MRQFKKIGFTLAFCTALAVSNLVQCQEPTGHDLMMKSDCMTCHKPDMRLVGPSFQEIAAKYKDQTDAADKLTDKVIAGGTGVWGQIPMMAHPNLPKEDVKKMVEWILAQQQ